jgi:phosphoadenosine phosphosulfate reductase
MDADSLDLTACNDLLKNRLPQDRIVWALETFRNQIFVSSSFGIQSAVTLHLATQAWPEIPIVLVDTGYLFPETYRFIDELTERLRLNLRVYHPDISSAWQEARYGKLWEQGLAGIEKYNLINKVDPMRLAVRELKAKGWIAGLRREQSSNRKQLDFLARQGGVYKIHPILDWSNRDIHTYLKTHNLPYHPLWEEGYVSVGDVHTTRKLEAGMTEEETRFFGLKRECGLHESKTDYSI